MVQVEDFNMNPPDRDIHQPDCLCYTCHELRPHDWRDVAGPWPGPFCEPCENDMLDWLKENVDEPMCACGNYRILSTCGEPVDIPICGPCLAQKETV